jgi:hypothetical protein
MLHKFKITTCAFILCLFGLTLITVSPVFASSPEFIECQEMKGKEKKKNCFRDLALALIETSRVKAGMAADPSNNDIANEMASEFCGLQRCCDGKNGIHKRHHESLYNDCRHAYLSGGVRHGWLKW